MARNHARILTAIWQDPEFLALPAGPQRMFICLLSQSKITMVGSLDHTPLRWAGLASDLTVEVVEDAIGVLEAGRFLLVDRAAEEIVVRTFVRHDGGARSPKTRAAMWSAWSAIASDRLRAEVIEHLPEEAWASPAGSLGEPPAAALALRDTPSDRASDGVPDAAPASTPDPDPDAPPDGVSDGVSDTASDGASDTPRNPEACNLPPASGSLQPDSADASSGASPGSARKRDEIWDTLLEVCGLAGQEPTKSARGAWNRAAAELRGVKATPDEIRARAAAFRRRWPDVSLTPNALARRWAESIADNPPPSARPDPTVARPTEFDIDEHFATEWSTVVAP